MICNQTNIRCRIVVAEYLPKCNRKLNILVAAMLLFSNLQQFLQTRLYILLRKKVR